MKTKNTASRRRAGEKLSVDSGSRMSDPYTAVIEVFSETVPDSKTENRLIQGELL